MTTWGHATATAFDDLGRVTSVTFGGDTALTDYDDVGNVESVTDGEGNVTRYTRDVLGRATGVTDAYGTALARAGQRARAARLMEEDRAAQSASDLYHRSITVAGQQRDNPEAHRTLARICQKENRLPRAILEWSEVLRLKPDDPEAKAGILACKKKRGDLYL